MPQRRTYLIAPDFTFQEKTGAIQIGNIIADPTRPHRTLSTITKEDLRARYPRIDSTPEDPHIIQNIDSKSESGTLWAKFISMASAELSAEHKSHTETKYEMDSIRTKQFVSDPDEAEIIKRVAVTKVQAVMNEKRFFDLGGGTPVYMISAVKIARGLRYASADIHGVGSSASASGEALTPAGDLSVGGMLSASHDRSRLDEGGLRVNVVFAYKVLIIEYAHWRGQELSVDEYLPKRKDGFLSSDNVGNKRQAEDADIGHPIVREAAESDLAPISEAVQVSQAQLNNEDELFMVVFPKRN